MPHEDQARPRFDEQKATAELERLQQELEESRRRRKDASAAFDAFVNSFHHKEPRTPTDRPTARTQSRQLGPKLDLPVGMAASGAAGASWQMPVRRRTVPVPLILGGAVAISVGLVLTRSWRTSGEESSTAARPVVARPSADPAAPGRTSTTTAAVGAAAAPASGAFAGELVALRGVWVRAIADGVRVIERELRPDERVPLRAARSVVIRVGDAGAVKMYVNGQDRGVLGANGIVVTRTFNAAAPQGRSPSSNPSDR